MAAPGLEDVNVHDFIDPKLKRAVPYGVYDIRNRWWRTMGKKTLCQPQRSQGDG
jgi:hypothetical protein